MFQKTRPQRNTQSQDPAITQVINAIAAIKAQQDVDITNFTHYSS